MESRQAGQVRVLGESHWRVGGIDPVPPGRRNECRVADESVDEDPDEDDRRRDEQERSQRVPGEMAERAALLKPLPRCGAGDRQRLTSGTGRRAWRCW